MDFCSSTLTTERDTNSSGNGYDKNDSSLFNGKKESSLEFGIHNATEEIFNKEDTRRKLGRGTLTGNFSKDFRY